jgi:hypothetical protein
MVTYHTLDTVFAPPFGGSSWDYGFRAALETAGRSYHSEHQVFDFEQHGRSPGRFEQWSLNYSKSMKFRQSVYNEKPVLMAGVCGGQRDFLTTGTCLPKLLPKFAKCAADHDGGPKKYLFEPYLNIPFFLTLFANPTKWLSTKLKEIRDRLGKSTVCLFASSLFLATTVPTWRARVGFR